MAKNSGKGGNSKVRLIVFEAEISDGDLSQVTQAIQNALQPRQTVLRTTQTSSPMMLQDSTPSPYVDDEEGEPSEEAFEPAKTRSRSSRPRVAKTPTVLDDIDFNSNPSLKDFVSEFELTSAVDKYLAIALWFRDTRSTPAITVDHVYTAFKMLGWGTNSNDFAKPLRNLRDEQSFKGGSREGFILTLPGAGKIEAKKRAA